MHHYPCVHINLQNIKKFASERFKHTRSGKYGFEGSTHWSICEPKDLGEVQPHSQNSTSRLHWYVTAYEKYVQGKK